jgi:hypothetical protein
MTCHLLRQPSIPVAILDLILLNSGQSVPYNDCGESEILSQLRVKTLNRKLN